MSSTGFPTPAPKGHKRAMTHGAYTPDVVGPVQARYVEQLREEFPDAHHTEIVSQAARVARMELVYQWLADEGVMHTKPTRKGEGWNILRLLSQWETASERWHERRREEQREAKHIDPDAAWDEALKEFNPPDADVVEDGDPGDLDGEPDDA